MRHPQLLPSIATPADLRLDDLVANEIGDIVADVAADDLIAAIAVLVGRARPVEPRTDLVPAALDHAAMATRERHVVGVRPTAP